MPSSTALRVNGVMGTIRVGIVGCGEVSQVMHIPALRQLRDEFVITALCDTQEAVLAGVAAQVNAPLEASTDYRELVASPAVDAVLVANPNIFHADVALAAMAHGKDVLIEKPMCMTLAEADALRDAVRRSGRVAQVGYMRRYAAALQEAAELVAERHSDIRLAQVHDVIGRNAAIVDDTSAVIRAPDPDGQHAARLRERERGRVFAAIGHSDGGIAASYGLLLGLGSHDLSAMRALLGRPRRVLHAAQRHDGQYLTATFDYGDFVCLFSIGLDEIPRYDTYLEVYTASKIIRVDYDTPYIRNVPARLTIVETHGAAGVKRQTNFISRRDSFVAEWLAFYACITKAVAPRTTIEDARVDLELSLEIIRRIEDDAARQA